MGFNLEGYVLRPGRVATSNSTASGEATTSVNFNHDSEANLSDWYGSVAPSRTVAPYADMYRAAVLGNPDLGTDQYCLFAASNGYFSGRPVTGNETEGRDFPTFWWTRNDAKATRFGWDGAAGRWYPLKGTKPQDVGMIQDGGEYKLSPPPTRFSVTAPLSTLPGDMATPDGYALMRYGDIPDSSSTPMSVCVVADSEIDTGDYLSGWSSYDAAVGVANGTLLLNPTFITANKGRTIWYSGESFVSENDGDIGLLSSFSGQASSDSNIGFPCLSPIPFPTERPFLTFGNRTYLTPIPYEDDASLPAPSALFAGSFAWSVTTGKIVLAAADIGKAIPGDALYNIEYLKAPVRYLGVALNQEPVSPPTTAPALNDSGHPLVGLSEGGAGIEGGSFYLPTAMSLPVPGFTGVRLIPDSTGEIPTVTAGAQTRPSGTGLMREVEGSGDTFMYTAYTSDSEKEKAYANFKITEYAENLPPFDFGVRNNTAHVATMTDATVGGYAASPGMINPRGVKGQGLHFAQAEVVLSYYNNSEKMYSRLSEGFTLTGNEKLKFELDSVPYEWDTTLSGGIYTAEEVISSLLADTTPLLPEERVGAFRGHLYLSGTQIIIGWNTDVKDLSGHGALGFLPGWKMDGASHTYLPDNGVSVGLYRSPINLSGRRGTPDIHAFGTFVEEIVTDSIPGTPFYHVALPPLEDKGGFNLLPGTQNVHFQMKLGLLDVDLPNYGSTGGIGIKYEWENKRLVWTAETPTSPTQIVTPTNLLQLDAASTISETVSSAAMAPVGSGFGLYLREAPSRGTPLPMSQELVEGTDFLMPSNGMPGQASLINVYGKEIFTGGNGVWTTGSDQFTDSNVDQSTLASDVAADDLLHIISGDNQGLYHITSVESATPTVLTVTPSFRAISTGEQWRVYKGISPDIYDPSIVADVLMAPRNHLPEEPFKIRALSQVGTVPAAGPYPPVTAEVADALNSERATFVRIGLESRSDQLPVEYLSTGAYVGGIAALGLVLPLPLDSHVTGIGTVHAFQLRVGADVFSTDAGNMTLNGGGSPAAGFVDVDTTTGDIVIASDLVSSLGGSSVYYDQTLFPSAQQPSTYASCDGSSGNISIPNSAFSGKEVDTPIYFVERMVTEGKKDVATSPMAGGIFFQKALREGQVVEAAYYQADGYGDKKVDEEGSTQEIVEFLPLPVRLEQATKETSKVFTFNPEGKTVSTVFEPMVWAGSDLQNYAGKEDCTINTDESKISFAEEVLAESETKYDPWRHEPVKITYGVLEAFGGEQAYSVSTIPVYRKPFFIEEGKSEFALQGDRTSDFIVDSLILVGPAPFYITSSTYSAALSTTVVGFFPPTQREVGSRSPGNDEPLQVSDLKVAWTSSGGGAQGFLMELDIPYLDADKGQFKISFYGDATRWAAPEHIIEVGGYPYVVANSSLSDDGKYTIVEVATALYTKCVYGTDITKFSSRPVYRADPTSFRGISGLDRLEEFALFLSGSTDGQGERPGKELVLNVDYDIDFQSGAVLFKKPNQGPLSEGESLWLRYTALSTIAPIVQDGAVLAPVFSAKNLSMAIPSVENRILGSILKAQYTFRNPDSFFFETTTLKDYLPQVSEASKGQVSTVGSGPPIASPGETDIAKQGSFGLRSEVGDFKDQDRAARAYIEYFNEIIVAFEQVLETIDGRVIGDRDGKFKFFIGRDKAYPPPGYEDPITGELNKRVIWREIIENWAPSTFSSAGGYFEERDAVFNPITANVPEPADRPGDPGGDNIDPDLLSFFLSQQKSRIRNDMDDRLLVGLKRPKGIPWLFPIFKSKGKFEDMWQPHTYSRLYPETTHHFSRLYPGLEATFDSDGAVTNGGYYTFGRTQEVPGPEPGETTEQLARTLGSEIGVVANPAIGEITGITDINSSDRRARARIWAYYPNGSQELDDETGLNTYGYATIIATPLQLSDFPLKDNGLPDAFALLNSGGDLSDLGSGDGELFTPEFRVGDRVSYGKPPGPLGQEFNLTDIAGDVVYVKSVSLGYVLMFKDRDGNQLTGLNLFVNGTTPLEDVVSDGTGYGDTIYVSANIADLGDLTDSDSPTLTQLTDAASSIPDYRMPFDLRCRRRKGSLTDTSLPTSDDDFILPLQSLFGQNPPTPLSCIEGQVDFVNTAEEPLQLPALLGEDKNDSGDWTIPYLKSTDCEIIILRAIEPSFRTLLADTTYSPLPSISPNWPPLASQIPWQKQFWDSIYPDEGIVSDGTIYTNWEAGPFPTTTEQLRNPRVLYTSTQAWNEVIAGSYVAGSALGNPLPYDLALVETGNPLDAGSIGILSVGNVFASGPAPFICGMEPPRFATPVQGTRSVGASGGTTYTFKGYIGSNTKATNGGKGMFLNELHNPSAGIDLSVYLRLDDFDGPDLSNIPGKLSTWPTQVGCWVAHFYDPSPSAPTLGAYLGAIFIPQWNEGATHAGSGAKPQIVVRTSAGILHTFPIVAAPTGIGVEVDPGGLYGDGVVQIDLDWSVTGGPGVDICDLLGLVNDFRYDFTLDLDTFIDWQSAAALAATIASGTGTTTSAIGEDRLTWYEDDLIVSNFPVVAPDNQRISYTLPRGSRPANGSNINGDMEGRLYVHLCEASGTGQGFRASTVNAPANVNGGDPFTFLERLGEAQGATPGWEAGMPYTTMNSSSGKCIAKVMGWEGYENSSIQGSGTVEGLKVSLLPSSFFNEEEPICMALGRFPDSQVSTYGDPGVLNGNRNYITTPTPLNSADPYFGSLENIQSGDILTISGGELTGGIPPNVGLWDGGAIKAGTYLVRHAIPYDEAALSPKYVSGNIGGYVGDDVPLKWSGAMSLAGAAGSLDLTFPTVVSWVNTFLGSHTITAQDIVGLTTAQIDMRWPVTAHLRLIMEDNYATNDGATYTSVSDSVWSAPFISRTYDPATGLITFVFNSTGFVALTASDSLVSLFPTIAATLYFSKLSVGMRLSGFEWVPMGSFGGTFPDNNVVGSPHVGTFSMGATPLVAGFSTISAGNVNRTVHSGMPGFDDNASSEWGQTWASDDGAGSGAGTGSLCQNADAFPAGAVPNDLCVDLSYTPADNTVFQENPATPVYGIWSGFVGASAIAFGRAQGVPGGLLLSELALTAWERIRFGDESHHAGSLFTLACILPSDVWTFNGGFDASTGVVTRDGIPTPLNPTLTVPDATSGTDVLRGFYALSGVFLEPSFPRPTLDLAGSSSRVVTATVPAAAVSLSEIGARDVQDYASGLFATPRAFEHVTFYVKRIRRFHEAQNTIGERLAELKYVYSIRRGTVDTYDPATRIFTADLSTGNATNIGNFNDTKVNINAGDSLRIYTEDGDLLDSAEIQKVESFSTLKLTRPGLTVDSTFSNLVFEVYLRQPLVPHEQSCDQLLDLVTDKLVFRRNFDYDPANPTAHGGLVEAYNALSDTGVDGSTITWAGLDARVDDYVVIDPAGPLFHADEEGMRPVGDTSVESRSPWVKGSPEITDDNRGFYKITKVEAGQLTVNGTSRFTDGSADGNSPVTFGLPASTEYAVMPTVSISRIDGGTGDQPEGQQALRPTSPASAPDYKFEDRDPAQQYKSIAPFGYRVIRPNNIFSADALELVLFMRERMLSWIEEIQIYYDNDKTSTYYIFQRDDHIEDIGSPGSLIDGEGLVTNAMMESVRGLVEVAPFANVSDCLSILDRRFWILDTNLDSQTPPSSATNYASFSDNAGDVRPVLPDLITEVLDLQDKFREQRYSWISFRAERVEGSIQVANRAEKRLPKKLRKQREFLLQQDALDKS